ncbi:MAG: SAM-dependent methyltransferase, partial [Nitrososphaeraceae archaeon]
MNGIKNKKNGKVYICGAGPGDPSLITMRCWDLIKICDVILYDRLVSSGILK